MIINGIQEVVYELEDINQKSIEVERAFRRYKCNFTKWSRAVFGVEGNDDTSPVPPFTVRHEGSILERFWNLSDAKAHYWYDTSDDYLTIHNYAGNVCWNPDTEE